MGVIIPCRKRSKINKIDLNNLSFDPVKNIKDLLKSNRNSVSESPIRKSGNRLYAFFRNFLPSKKFSSQSLKSNSLLNKQSKLTDINDTIKNIETAFQAKKHKKIALNQTNQTFLETFLLKNPNNAVNSRRKDSLFPTFIKKINEYKKHQMNLNGEDLHLFNILRNFFKEKKTKNQTKPDYELKNNKATIEFIKQQQKDSLTYYIDEIALPQKRTFNEEICSLFTKAKQEELFPQKIPENGNSMFLNLSETEQNMNNHLLEATFEGINLQKKLSLPKKFIKRSLSPLFRSTKPITDSNFKSSKNCSIEASETLKLKAFFPESPSPKNKSDLPSFNKPNFNKIVLNKCILPLRIKNLIKPENTSEFKVSFNDEQEQNPKNLSTMSPIKEEHSSKIKEQSGKNNHEESSNESSLLEGANLLMKKIEKTELSSSNFDSPNIKNQKNAARIIKHGKWDFAKFCENDTLLKKDMVRRERSLEKMSKTENEKNKNNSGTPIRKVVRNGKCYNILKKSENLIIRNNKAVQVLQEDSEFLERLKKKKWFDGLDNLSKISYKNVSPTMFYFCRDRGAQKNLLNFEDL